jgi:Splicing factor SF3a60 binding domain
VQIKIYDDEEGIRSAEIAKLGGATQFSVFYERLKDIKEHYRRAQSYETTQPPDDDAVIDAQARRRRAACAASHLGQPPESLPSHLAAQQRLLHEHACTGSRCRQSCM